MSHLLTSIRLSAVTIVICSGLYTALILGFAQLFTPGTANGSLLSRADGTVLGSSLIAQQFQQPRYFWPRPSAVDCNASATGGSNKSPTSTDLTERAQKTVAAHGATSERPLPADLAAASGCGLDPHISEQAALYQIARIAAARASASRSRSRAQIEAMVRERAFTPGVLAKERVVNVLELNLALDTGP